jgi:hypothetical protein
LHAAAWLTKKLLGALFDVRDDGVQCVERARRRGERTGVHVSHNLAPKKSDKVMVQLYHTNITID